MKRLGITYLQELGIGLSFVSTSSHSRGTAEALTGRRSFTLMGTSRIDPGNGTARAINSIPMPALELVNRPHCLYRRPAPDSPERLPTTGTTLYG